MAPMSLSTSRARYLSAIAAVLPSLAVAACKDQSPPAVAPTEGGSTQTTTPPVATPETPYPLNMPSCPSGAFCTAEPAKLDSQAAAPAPYAKCGATATHPEDVGRDARSSNYSVSFSAEGTARERTKTASACCYKWVSQCPGGRVFRDATGTPSVARTIERTDWSAALSAIATAALSPETRSSLAEHWTREAAFEHASIASFAQLTLDLLSVGAPPELLAATQRAALDEIEHARISFALATAYGGRPVGPAALAALPGACRSLADIARTTFIDACVGESVASASLAEDSRQAVDPVLRDLLASMAEDEERHAELAWRIVAWALRSGDPAVGRALTEAQTEVIDELVTLTHAAVSARHELRATVLREVVIPCSVALLSAASQDTAQLSRRSRDFVAA